MFPHILKGSEFGGLGEKVSRSPRVKGSVIDGWRRLEVVLVRAEAKKG